MKNNINVNFEHIKIILSLHYHFHDINKALSVFLEKELFPYRGFKLIINITFRVPVL